jgi:hypothetical protein
MSFWSRIANVFREERVNREIDEELKSHIEEAVAQGRELTEVRRSFGAPLHLREESRDIRLLSWLESLRADAVFGWRQIVKNKVASAAAILSLALAIGACTSAFRLIDALLLRPLPVSGAGRLYSVAFQSPSAADGSFTTYDSCSYPMFLRMRLDVKDQAESIAISMYNGPVDLTYGSDQEMERVDLQYVSGWMFGTFGLRPAAGRLLVENDDLAPGAHPYAVLSYDYWTRRFGRKPQAVGRRFRIGNDAFEIVGVAGEGFTGTETGSVTDIFVPMAMKNPRTLASLNNFWLRTLLQLKPGVMPGPVQEKLRATFRGIQEERAKGFPAQSQRDRERFFQERLSLEHAAAISPGACGSCALSGSGAPDCLRQRGQPDGGAGCVAGARNGAPRRDRRRALAAGAIDPGRERLACVPGHRDRLDLRMVVGARYRGNDQPAG